ncbi:MAG: Chromosome partition protein Smc [Mycoplasmataceae bacterium]|nr:MAG: Chromosome partition protein Smc [Mycoplasmataceae bacterium]
MTPSSTLRLAKKRLASSASKFNRLLTIRSTREKDQQDEEKNEESLLNIYEILRQEKLANDNSSNSDEKIKIRNEIISDLEENLRDLNSRYCELINKNEDEYSILKIKLIDLEGEIDTLNISIDSLKEEIEKLEENNSSLAWQNSIKDNRIKGLIYNFENKDVNLNVFFKSLKFVNFHKKIKLFTLLIIDSSRVFLPNYFDFIFEIFTEKIVNDFDVEVPVYNKLFWNLFGFFIIFSFLRMIYKLIKFIIFSFFNFFLKLRGFGSNELKKWKDFPKLWKKNSLKNLEIKRSKNK